MSKSVMIPRIGTHTYNLPFRKILSMFPADFELTRAEAVRKKK